MPPSENTHGRTRLSFASVADIDECRNAWNLREVRPHLDVDGVEVVFAVIDQNQQGGMAPGNLPAQLGADRAAGAGDQDPSLVDQAVDRLPFQLDLRPRQQILDGDRPQIEATVIAGIAEFGRFGQTAERYLCLLCNRL